METPLRVISLVMKQERNIKENVLLPQVVLLTRCVGAKKTSYECGMRA